MVTRLVQISDLHLLADPNAELKGVRTRESLQKVLAAVRREAGPIDRLIVTGDLAHDERLETYEALREMLSEWLPALRMIPGNHDNRATMWTAFGMPSESLTDRCVFVDTVGGWKLIGLDSQLAGEVRGQLGSHQQEWLARELRQEPRRSTAVFVHHPPVPIGSEWLDQIGLEDAGPLLTLLAQFPEAKFLSCGHVHQELTALRNAVLILATPSTGVQFQPGTPALVVDSVSPGFRIFDLEFDGSFRTRVVRVPS